MNNENKKFEDLDKDDFTEEEFQNLVNFIKFLSKMDRKYNPASYIEATGDKQASDSE